MPKKMFWDIPVTYGVSRISMRIQYIQFLATRKVWLRERFCQILPRWKSEKTGECFPTVFPKFPKVFAQPGCTLTTTWFGRKVDPEIEKGKLERIAQNQVHMMLIEIGSNFAAMSRVLASGRGGKFHGIWNKLSFRISFHNPIYVVNSLALQKAPILCGRCNVK